MKGWAPARNDMAVCLVGPSRMKFFLSVTVQCKQPVKTSYYDYQLSKARLSLVTKF